MERDTIIGAILAGGQASRLGGGDKGLLAVGGRPIIERVLAVLRRRCDPVILNANGDPARLAALGLPIVADSLPGHQGPLAGVLAALDWAAAHRPGVLHVVTAPGDTPFLPDDLVDRLEARRRETGAAVVTARSGGQRHPVASLWPVDLREDLRRSLGVDGIRGMGAFLDRQARPGRLARSRILTDVDWPIDPLDPFLNINTPDDLMKAQKIVPLANTHCRL